MAFDRFVASYGAKYPKATEKLTKDRDALLAFYDFPAEHWAHLRTTNPIESTFATVRHRTTRTRNCASRVTLVNEASFTLAFKLIEEAEKSWRRIRGAEKIELLLKGVTFKDGEAVPDNPPPQQNLCRLNSMRCVGGVSYTRIDVSSLEVENTKLKAVVS